MKHRVRLTLQQRKHERRLKAYHRGFDYVYEEMVQNAPDSTLPRLEAECDQDPFHPFNMGMSDALRKIKRDDKNSVLSRSDSGL